MKLQVSVISILLFFIIVLLLYYLKQFNNIETFEVANNSTKKIALCFIIYDKIHNEKLWYDYLKSVDKNKYTIYIHYKENKPLKYFNIYKISNIVDTCWGCLSVVEAQLLILNEALKDSNNQHFIWLSQSCIPVKSFDYIYNNLNQDVSYFTIASDPNILTKAKYCLKYINKDKVKKAAMPSIINRKHAELFLENKSNILKWFKNINNVDEIALITMIYHLGVENEIKTSLNLSSDPIIFAAWSDMSNYKLFNESSLKKNYPNEYNKICYEELKFIVDSESLFARKFIDNCEGLDKLFTLIN